MARPIKTGLDYFPLDTSFFEDDKIQFVSARFEEKGELIAIKILCKVYKNGYFIKLDDDTKLLFAKSVGKNTSAGLVNDVVDELLKRDFFDRNLYMRFGILTSNGIQKRYLKICKDAKRIGYEIPPIYQLKELTPENNELTQEETIKIPVVSTQSKVKEIKEKEIILNKNEVPNFFYIGTELFKSPVSIYVKNAFKIFIENWEMRNKDITLNEVLSQMDINYCGYSFNNFNHIQNSFTSTARHLLDEKKRKNKYNNIPTTEVKATGNYGPKKQQ